MADEATTVFRGFFGDKEQSFRLTFPLVYELERQCGVGFALLSRRVTQMQWHARDLSEIIRMGLIGGGETPERAKQLTETYVEGRPIIETLPIAAGIVQAFMTGIKKDAEA